MHLTPEQKKTGVENFHGAVGSAEARKFTRRNFIIGSAATGAVVGSGLGAAYFGYDQKSVGDPLRVGIIGSGDEGNVLIGAINPNYVQVVAVADIRPYNIHRTFHGDGSSDNALKVRPGLIKKYGWKSEDQARKTVTVYRDDYKKLLKDSNVEAVIIALPLHMHAEAAIAAMQAGKHVLTEKLMGHNVTQCKEMSRVSFEQGKLLATGHQRHYSILYENAVDMIRLGVLGYIHHIRAQWHRGNMPGKDTWQPSMPDDVGKQIERWSKELTYIESDFKFLTKAKTKSRLVKELKKRKKAIEKAKRWEEYRMLDKDVNAESYGYISKKLANGRDRPALEELIRWRLWDRTGGGLMAELGSHQLDAAGIFISAMSKRGKHVHPLTVSGMGGRHIFALDRDCDDHVYCMFEFPGLGADEAKLKDNRLKNGEFEDKVVVSYSSINGNGFGGHGETVIGTKGVLVLDREKEVMLFGGSSTTSVKVKKTGAGPTLDTTASGAAEQAAGKKALGEASRGYTEEIEHWAWCIRQIQKGSGEADFKKDPENYEFQSRCKPSVALGDAVIALTANIAIKTGDKIDFKEEWFDIFSKEVPEDLLKNGAKTT